MRGGSGACVSSGRTFDICMLVAANILCYSNYVRAFGASGLLVSLRPLHDMAPLPADSSREGDHQLDLLTRIPCPKVCLIDSLDRAGRLRSFAGCRKCSLPCSSNPLPVRKAIPYWILTHQVCRAALQLLIPAMQLTLSFMERPMADLLVRLDSGHPPEVRR